MNEQTTGFRPLNCNPHHELLVSLQTSLAQCSDGDRERLFETREQLGDLTRRIEEGPWGILSSLTNAVQAMFGHLLRRGNLDGPEAMQVATEVIAFVDAALTLSPPDGSEVVHSDATDKIGLSDSGNVDGLKLQLSPDAHFRDAAATSHSAPPDSALTLRYGSQRGSRSGREMQRTGPNHSKAELGMVAYQMVNESRLGELLIKMGCIETAQLDRALVLQKLSRKRLGDVLMAMEAVDLASLQAALKVQRQETLRFMDNRQLDGRGRIIGEAS